MADWVSLVMIGAADGSPESPMMAFVMMIVMIGLVYYLIIFRPQRREQTERQKTLATLEKGDRVVTIGGIHGTVVALDEAKKTVSVDVGKNVRIEFSRNAISAVEKKGKKAAEETTKEKDAREGDKT